MVQLFWKLFVLVMTLSLMRADVASQGNKSSTNVASAIGKGIAKEISAVKQPIDETIVSIGSSQCSHVKKIFGVAYEQIEGAKEPNLNLLTMELRNNGSRTLYNITTAAELIPRDTFIDFSNKLFIYIHGFTDDPTSKSFGAISDSFLKQGEYNVLALDASSLISWLYLRSTTYIRFIGEKLGGVLAAMVNNGVKPSDIHIVGHSLGAHISGFAGKTFHNLTGFQVRRISGLDPAGPCFTHVDPDLRLKKTDAEFVDVMHTDAGVYGLKDPIGHVDFYPNGGSKQPNCLFQTCSHSRAWELYSESVLDHGAFLALKCDDWEAYKSKNCTKDVTYMGYPAKSTARGLYYLRTGDESPYGLGKQGLEYKGESGVINNVVAGGKSIATSISNASNKLLG